MGVEETGLGSIAQKDVVNNRSSGRGPKSATAAPVKRENVNTVSAGANDAAVVSILGAAGTTYTNGVKVLVDDMVRSGLRTSYRSNASTEASATEKKVQTDKPNANQF